MDIKYPTTIKEPVNADKMREFVKSYLLDYDAKKAVVRIGLSALHANTIVEQFMSEPFVLNLIKEEEAKAAEIASNPELIKQEVIKNLLAILKNDGESLKPSDRIASAKMLTDLLALAPKQQVQDNQVTTNVLVCPPAMNADDWSALAMQSQQELKAKLEASL